MSESENKAPKLSGGLGSNDREIKSVKFRRKLSLMVGGGVLALLLLVLTVGQIVGFSYFGFKRPSQKVAVRTVVCDQEIIKRLNDIRSSDSDNDTIRERVDQLADEIAAKPHVDEDPTCQQIIFWSALGRDDLETAKAVVNNTQNAYDKGIFVDGNMSNITPLDTMKDFVRDDLDIQGGAG